MTANPPPQATPSRTSDDERWMTRALQLAAKGEGSVEPNPMVGCVIVKDGQVVGEGYHAKFGGPHAERAAFASVADKQAIAGATWYVTLEPCCHTGKTPPCTDIILQSAPARVVVAMRDPFPKVDGGGLRLLSAAGIQTDCGILESDAQNLNQPYLIRLQQKRPWVIAKWAMTLDGKIATKERHSQWISGPESRADVHTTRGRCDAVIVGGGTASKDDPTLTARPPGPRIPTRIVISKSGRLKLESKLVQTIDEGPVWLFTAADGNVINALADAGVTICPIPGNSPTEDLQSALIKCGEAGMTNVLVEGGGELLANFFAADLIDECHVYIAPKLVGGTGALGPIGGDGLAKIPSQGQFEYVRFETFGPDLKLVAKRKR
ncbi:Riboflavin biosynthesis protein RibD [Roseimaritima multifibrata]|uniref:Riboflavin biosynthesis protein RibD n=1 Tax=Roseimaritima multifibrata TaxID=1930274 RepID=A0A517MCT2_9BACT|nr:bifunctional diaminohydroxyphosphoribosylaminopyrimidine deaminase/5-amino-6-(5-phosphoribosylamino)uracil reductase RibD [Roseimaritima multifibrata]QDS92699.1 Riboflavin biosynthesis protein RibD [Roseimaritima multifibrata]